MSVQKDRYFEGNRKGEVKELQKKLRTVLHEKGEKARREAISKVLLEMTRGVDVSGLFLDMVQMNTTKDLVEKKMIYYYLVHQAEENPENAIMAISTFQKECQHSDPKVKGLALRSLGGMRLSQAFEYMVPCVREALREPDSYVKRAAIMGHLKVFYTKPDSFAQDARLAHDLYGLIRDHDPIVAANALLALEEMLRGGVVVTRKMAHHLLGRLKEFNEWGQSVVLDLLYKYEPRTDKETFEIMNSLDDRLRKSCSSVVFAAIKLFLKYTASRPKIFQQVIGRIGGPLLTLMASYEMGSLPELTYVVLKHIQAIILCHEGQPFFEKNFRYFYCRFDEPSYNKQLKLEILAALASPANLGDIMNELAEYIYENDLLICRQSIRALTAVAVRIPEIARAVLKQFSAFLTLRPPLSRQLVVAIAEVLRRYPREFKEVKEALEEQAFREVLEQGEGRPGALLLLGTFGEDIPFAPYLLEDVASQGLRGWEEASLDALLVNAIKLFIKRPIEAVPCLRLVLRELLAQPGAPLAVRDKAAFYYRSMQKDFKEFKKLFFMVRAEYVVPLPAKFAFDTFSLVYGQPSDSFLKPLEYFTAKRRKEEGIDELLEAHEVEGGEVVAQENLLEEGVVEKALARRMLGVEDLDEDYEMEQEEFQSIWELCADQAEMTRVLLDASVLDTDNLDQLFSLYRLRIMASGEEEDQIRMYVYAVEASSQAKVCCEVDVNRAQNVLVLRGKSGDEDLAAFVLKFVEGFFVSEGLI